MRFSDLEGRRVAVWGYGREGQAVVARLAAVAESIIVAEPDREAGADIDGIDLRFADAGRQALLDADVVVKSPGVPATAPLYDELSRARVPITSLTDLWLADNAHRTIAVTGTKGKSTTGALIDHLLRGLGRNSVMLGNIGRTVLDEPTPPADLVVLEVSSYQAQSLSTSPRIAVVTSLFPEHLPWHGSAEQYFEDKLHLVDHAPDWVLAPDAQPDLVDRLRNRLDERSTLIVTGDLIDASGDLSWPDGTVVRAEELPLRGRHNAANIALAIAAVALVDDSPPASVAQALASFRGLPHRAEPVPSNDSRIWVDDSLATAPQAVVATLESFSDRAVAVVVGGADRGLDFTPLVEYAVARAADLCLLLVGPAGRRVADQLGADHAGHQLFASFGEALAWARSDANPAGVVLLSPGAPSFDEFADYTKRSEAFRAAALA